MLVCATMLVASAEAPQQDADMAWLVGTSRMEGAASNIKETSNAFQTTAQQILAQQRLTGLAELISDSEELNRRVVSAALAAEVLTELKTSP